MKQDDGQFPHAGMISRRLFCDRALVNEVCIRLRPVFSSSPGTQYITADAEGTT